MFDPAFQRLLHGVEYASSAAVAPCDPTRAAAPPLGKAIPSVGFAMSALEMLQQAIRCNKPTTLGYQTDLDRAQDVVLGGTTSTEPARQAAPQQTHLAVTATVTSPKEDSLQPAKVVSFAPQPPRVVEEELPEQVFRARLPGRRGQTKHAVAPDLSPDNTMATRTRMGPSPHALLPDPDVPSPSRSPPTCTPTFNQTHRQCDSDSDECVDMEEVEEDTSSPSLSVPVVGMSLDELMSSMEDRRQSIRILATRLHSLGSSAAPPRGDRKPVQARNREDLSDRPVRTDLSLSSASSSLSERIKMLRKSIGTTPPKKRSKYSKPCIEKGCQSLAQRQGRCRTHGGAKMCKYNGPTGQCTQPAPYHIFCREHVPTCLIDGCANMSVNGATCRRHSRTKPPTASVPTPAKTSVRSSTKRTVPCDSPPTTNTGLVSQHRDKRQTLRRSAPRRQPEENELEVESGSGRGPTRAQCKHVGPDGSCTRSPHSGGLCRPHGGAKCKHVGPDGGCTRSVFGNGLCRSHGGAKVCAHPGCTRGQQRNGLCYGHGISTCRVDGCGSKDRGNGLCRSHGRGTKKDGG